MKVAVPKERPGEARVALVPDVVQRLVKLDVEVLIQAGAGHEAFYSDQAFEAAGATIINDASSLYSQADVVLRVQPPTQDQAELLRDGSMLIGFLAPYSKIDLVKTLARKKITSLSMELVPRITRAQSMDALSSQASIAGYKAAILAADKLAKFVPMLTTPTGTIRPAKALVVGAGVAGLQAIATLRRLGAMVEAYDVRSATKEQVQSLGAKFLEIDVAAEGTGGYARELTEEEKRLQQEMLARHIAEADVVISTAAVPGRKAPRIISTAMAEAMRPGAVIIDVAAESGGNCELTVVGKSVFHNQVEIVGPACMPSMMAVHSSEMYAKNLYNLFVLMINDGRLEPDWEDEILRESRMTYGGDIVHAPTRELAEAASSGGAA